ncbi:hypothetical protein [Xylophilus ampelinus]|uniref:Uncharacterized protein n=1 Tax=Xylophilus ampelinus TaxID=54067 RepID=A0A318SL66_9BURK|nr:hypothetical protein [Xylophilus ampelinus]MCS4509228.1 hypothetical protein [Xylophilus ampelinus]PYE79745.1 hypothetical protein DFQ15_10165 [Xylophilus ampelinus]
MKLLILNLNISDSVSEINLPLQNFDPACRFWMRMHCWTCFFGGGGGEGGGGTFYWCVTKLALQPDIAIGRDVD